MCFVKIIHLILMYFFLKKFQCFEEWLHQILLIFKNSFFLQFRSIESVFQLIEIAIKNFSESLSVLIDRNCFSINWISWISFFFFFFFKFNVWPVQNTFSKVFSHFLSLSDSAKQNHPIFVIFLRIFCKFFLSQSR